MSRHEKLSGFTLETVLKPEPKPCGNLYPQSIDNAPSAIPTFGRLMRQSYPVRDIEPLVKKVGKPIISSDLTAPYAKESLDWCEKRCRFLRSWTITLEQSGTSFITTMHPYLFRTTDLRQRIIAAYKAKAGSQRQLAERFQVSLSFIRDLRRHYRETGAVQPKPHGGGAVAKLGKEQLPLVEALVMAQPDALLEELCERFAQQTGVEVRVSTVQRAMQRLKFSIKKNFDCR